MPVPIRSIVARTGVVIALLVGTFCALGGQNDLVRIGLFTDLHAHDLDSPVEGKWMSHTEERLTAFVEAMNARKPDFVIELGDFVNGWVVLGVRPGSPDRIPDVLAWAEALYARFDGPRYHVIGNHDVYNLDKDQYLSIIGRERTYDSFDVGGYHFVILDVQFSEDGADLSHTYTGVAGFVPPRELEWLEVDLASSDRPTVVFVHQMLDTPPDIWGRYLVANQPEIQDLLAEDGDVVAVFQGHDHANAHNVIDGIHYITFEALVDQDSPPSWAYVTLDGGAHKITIVGEGEQASYDLDTS